MSRTFLLSDNFTLFSTMSGHLKTVTYSLATAAAALAAYKAITWWRNSRLPSKWRKVGTLVDIMCFPVKSCGVIKLQSSECEILGLRTGILRDRVFMVVDCKGSFITARAHPVMTQISPTIEDGQLVLGIAGQKPVKINIHKLLEQSRIKARVWGQTVDVLDCGNEVAAWLAGILDNGSEIKPRLVFYPHEQATREVRTMNRVFEKLKQKDVGALPDASSFNLIATASIDELNTRLSKKVTPMFFRPNFVVEGSKAYEEDSWDYIRIGDVVFRNVKPCTRCVFTTIDPETGIKDKQMEPLNTLKSYRQITEPRLRVHTGDSPVMGTHLALCVAGSVRLGDAVYVGVA